MNWIEKYKADKGKLPPVPGWLKPGIETEESIDKVKIITPSGQFWNNLSEKRQQEWRETCEFVGQDSEELLENMRVMIPKAPTIRR